MKYSFMSFSCPELALEEMLATASKYGYDAVEPRISAGHKHGIELDAAPEFRADCRRRAEDAGIAFSCVATSCRYADPATAEANVADTHKAIDLAADIGCSRIRVFGGQVPEGVSRDAAVDALAQCLGDCAAHAADRGVYVCMETHDDWCHPEHVAAVVSRVDQPFIAVNWDIMHPVRVARVTMQEAFAALHPRVRHVHFHDGRMPTDGKLELCPVGQGIVDHGAALSLLAGAGYDGYFSGEWINWEPWQEHLPRELATMKGLEQQS